MAAANSMAIKHFFQLKKVPVGIYPLVGIIGMALTGASYFVYHSAMGPEIKWDKRNNPVPNFGIKRTENTKLYDPFGHFPEKWQRKSL